MPSVAGLALSTVVPLASFTVVEIPGVAFATLNGDVDVSLPGSFRGDLRMRSDNGEIYTDFDVQLATSPAKVEQQRQGGKYRLEVEQEVRGTIGGGGPEIQLRTFNGDIYLRKRG